MNKTKKDNVFWGVLFILAAVYIIINNFGFAPDVNVVKLVVAILCVVVFFKSLYHRVEFGGMLFSLAILAILFDDELGISAITPWPVLVAALLGSIGLSMIFGNHPRTHRRKGDMHSGMNESSVSGDQIVINGIFNGYKKNISSDHFTKADVSCKFCGMEISFDDVMIQDGSAVVNLELYFSGVEIYIPYSWKIVNNTDCVFGGFDEHRAGNGEEGPTLVFEGNVRFSGVDIYRI